MSLLWVPGVLRAAGLTVIEHDGWRTRSNGSLAADYWVWHHDASAKGDSPGVPSYMIGNYANAGAQLWVDRQGRWHIIAAGRAAHAGKVLPGKPGNSNSIGIETDHTTGEDWPPALLNSLRRGTAAMMKYRGKNENHLEFHKTICNPPGRKVDPDGLDLGHERAQIRSLLGGNSINTQPSIPEDDDVLTPQQDAALSAVYNAIVPGEAGVRQDGPVVALIRQAIAAGNLATDTARQAVENTKPIRRGGKDVPIRQEIADTLTLTIRQGGEIAGLVSALSQMSQGGTVDLDAVRAAAREGVSDALKSIETIVTIETGDSK